VLAPEATLAPAKRLAATRIGECKSCWQRLIVTGVGGRSKADHLDNEKQRRSQRRPARQRKIVATPKIPVKIAVTVVPIAIQTSAPQKTSAYQLTINSSMSRVSAQRGSAL
jgi:hypothetical protein